MIDQKTESRIKKIIVDGNPEELIKFAEELGKRFAPQNERERNSKLSSSQIRNILDDVQRMKGSNMGEIRNQLFRLRPKLAYAAGKTKPDNSLRQLQPILDKAIELIGDSIKNFNNFKDFFEAIVGYHRYHSKVREA